MTNLEGPGLYVQHSDYKSTDTFLDANTVKSVVIGRIWSTFFPGDQVPFGVVGEDSALYAFDGKATFGNLDLTTFAYTSFSYNGVAPVDVCAELAD